MTQQPRELSLLPAEQPKGPRLLLQHPRFCTGVVFMSAALAAILLLAAFANTGSFAEVLILLLVAAVTAFVPGFLFAPLLRRRCRTLSATIDTLAIGVLIAMVAQSACLIFGTLVVMLVNPLPDWAYSEIAGQLISIAFGGMFLLSPITAPSGALIAFFLYVLQTPKTAPPQLLGCGSHAQTLEKSE